MPYDWRPYVPVADRRRRAAAEARRRAKRGEVMSPVIIEGRKIARSFWGKAWCDNLEAYSDFANRLPRGRTYARNGSVIDLKISDGAVRALVYGSELYTIEVSVSPLAAAKWGALKADCAGAIESLVELLQGKFSEGVMARMCQQEGGLFPTPRELEFSCSCPDWARLCKHVAAALYGVGARLAERPELLFVLRGVDPGELLTHAASELPMGAAPAPEDVLDVGELDIFGLELDDPNEEIAAPQEAVAAPDAFREWLRSKEDDGTVVASFSALEEILGALPAEAKASEAWWADSAGAIQRRWIAEGFTLRKVWTERGWVVLERP